MPNIQIMENDPAFRKLPYYMQQRLRAGWISSNLSKDSQFQSLPIEAQGALATAIVMAPPKFSDPNIQKYMASLDEDRKAKGESVSKRMKVDQFVSGFYQSSFITKIAGRIAAGILETTDATGVQLGKLSSYWKKEDREKLDEYFRQAADGDVQKLSALDAMKTTGGFAGMMVETALMYGLLGGSVKAPKGLAKLAINVINENAEKIALKFASARIGNWVAREALPSIAHGVLVGGPVQMIRDTMNLVLTESQNKPSFGKIAATAALSFGSGALGDIMWFAATAPFVSMMKGVKGVFTLRKASGFLKDLGIDSKDFKAVLNSFAEGQHIPEEIISRLKRIAPETAEKLLSYEAHFITLRNFEKIPANHSSLKKLDAFRRGWDAKFDETTGKWDLTHLYDDTIKKSFANDSAMMQFLEEPASNWMQQLDPDKLVGLQKGIKEQTKKITALEAATAGAMTNNYYMRQKVRAKLGTDDATLATLNANILKPKGGQFVDQDIVTAARLYLKRMGVKDWQTIKIGAGLSDPGGYDLFIKKPNIALTVKDELDFVEMFGEKVDLFGRRRLAVGRAALTEGERAEFETLAGAREPPVVKETPAPARAEPIEISRPIPLSEEAKIDVSQIEEGGFVSVSTDLLNRFTERKFKPIEWDVLKKFARAMPDEDTFVSQMKEALPELSELDVRKAYLLAKAKSHVNAVSEMLADLDRPGYVGARKILSGISDLRRTGIQYEGRKRYGKGGVPLRGTRSGLESAFTSGEVGSPSKEVMGIVSGWGKGPVYTEKELARLTQLARKNPKVYARFYDPNMDLDQVWRDIKVVADGSALPEHEILGRSSTSGIYTPPPPAEAAARAASYVQPGGTPQTLGSFDDFARATAAKKGKEFARAYYKLVGQTESWANYASKKLGLDLKKGAKGGYDLAEPGKSPVHYNDFEDVTREILIRENDFTAIHHSMKEQGIMLRTTDPDPVTGKVRYIATETNEKIRGPEGKMEKYVRVDVKKGVTRSNIIAESDDLRKILDELNWQPKPSGFLGPEITYVSPDFGEIEYIRNIAVGNYQAMLRHLSSFRYAEEKVIPKFISQGKEGTIYFDVMEHTYDLIVPEVGFRKTFATRKDAISYMKKGWAIYDTIDRMADMKGYKVELGNGGWYVWNDTNQYFVRNFKEVKKIFAEAPLPEWSPELLGQTPKVPIGHAANPKVEEGMFRPELFDPDAVVRNQPLIHVSHRYRPTDAWMEQAIISGLPEEQLHMFEGVELGRRGAHADQLRVNQAILTIFQDPAHPGKVVDQNVRMRIFHYMDAYDIHKQEVLRQYAEMGQPLQPWEIKIADTASEYLDSFFEKFNIPKEMRVLNYISHIREMDKQAVQKLFRGTSSEILKKTGAPKQIHEFFKNARSADIQLLSHDQDALNVMMKYTSIGHRALYLGENISKLKGWAEMIGKSADATPFQKTAAWRMGAYIDDVMGIHTPGEEQIRQFFVSMGEKIGIKNQAVLKDLYSSMYSFSYLINMGWRPWSAVRNLFQIWTTLAPRFGNANTARGLEYVVKHPEQVIEMMRAKGQILEELPVVGTEMMNTQSLLGKLTHRGLAWFKNAEDLARSTAWATAKIQWDDALKVFSKATELGATFDRASASFLDVSGLNMVRPGVTKEALGWIRKNRWDLAFDAYSQEVINETMFGYAAGLNPTAYRGAVGRAFGTFGVYPAWYIENFKRGLKYGSVANRIGFAARFAGNGLSLFGAFTAIGINAKDFLPWIPMQFSGGPYYKTFNKLLSATGSDYAARQSRGELKNEIPRLLLPVSQINSLMDAVNHLESGNVIDAMASILSVPRVND